MYARRTNLHFHGGVGVTGALCLYVSFCKDYGLCSEPGLSQEYESYIDPMHSNDNSLKD